jgi:hypothetical protein
LPSIPFRILLTALLLAAIAWGARRQVDILVSSVETYRFPISNLTPGAPTQPLTQSLLLIIVDGLRYDTSLEMPNLQSLRRRGAHAQVIVPPPTASQPSWTTILSGAAPELNGAAVLNAPPDEIRLIAVDHLLRRARVMRRTTALAGHAWWRPMIPPISLDDAVYAEGTEAADDARLVDAAVELLQTRYPDVMVVHLTQVDTAGHEFGGASDHYYRAALRVDELIRRLANAVDLRISALAVTSDHGHLDEGGHGGAEPLVTHVPFVLVGPGVRPGDYGTIPQVDIAPTLAALLGLPIPVHSQGTIRFEMLEMSDPVRAEKAMALAAQQITLSEAYLEAIGADVSLDIPREELTVAHSAADIDNFEGAFEIAQLSAVDARKAREEARTARIAAERRERLPVTLGILAGLFAILWFTRSGLRLWLLGVALLAWLGPLGNADALATLAELERLRALPTVLSLLLGLATALWAWASRQRSLWLATVGLLAVGFVATSAQEGAFSPSAIRGVEPFIADMARRSAAALLLGGGAVLAALWHPKTGLKAVAQTGYTFVFLLLGILTVPAAVGYWLHGQEVTWYLPDATLLFFHFTTLTQMLTVAGLGVLLPLVTLPVFAALRLVGHQMTQRWQVEEARP